jgi:uncharacterized protein (DUF58 family)
MAIVPLLVAVVALGIVTGTTWFSLCVCASILVFRLSASLSRDWSEQVKVARTGTLIGAGSEIQIGKKVTIGLEVKNHSKRLIPWVLIEDTISKSAVSQPHRSLELIGSNVKLFELGAGQKGLLTYELRAVRRGYYRLGPTLLETGDLLGLNRQHRVVSGVDYLLVLPKLIPLQGMELTSRRPVGDMRVTDRSMEDPTQMAGVREYRQGDPLNRIHWKATARTGSLHTRVFEPTCVQGAMLLLDFHKESNPSQHEPMRTDLAATAAASIAHTLYQMNQPCGLISNGSDMAERYSYQESTGDYTDRESMRQSVQRERRENLLKPIVIEHRNGVESFNQIHKMLARLERSNGLSFFELVRETQSRIPRNLTLVVILQTVTDETAMALEMLRRQGYSISVILNHSTDDEGIYMSSRLIALRLPVYSLEGESTITHVCQNLLLMR